MTVGCTTVPRKYLREAIPDLTYSTLAATPQRYQDRLVGLEAVILKEEIWDEDLWLHGKTYDGETDRTMSDTQDLSHVRDLR
jgi:hypothetical protein